MMAWKPCGLTRGVVSPGPGILVLYVLKLCVACPEGSCVCGRKDYCPFVEASDFRLEAQYSAPWACLWGFVFRCGSLVL